MATSASTFDLSWPAVTHAMQLPNAVKPFVTGSIAGCMATCLIQPMDMIKVRIQIAAMSGGTVNPLTIGWRIISTDGITSLYSGLSAGLVRQVVYTGSRLGLYDKFVELARDSPDQSLPVHKTASCALAAGGIAALIGNPADLALIRMQSDSLLPKTEQRGYKNVFQALGSIIRSEGAFGLLKGAGPTATRAMGLNLGMLGGNTEAKQHLSKLGLTGYPLVLGASAVAGFFASALSLPFDYVKTLMQNQKPDLATGRVPYNSSFDCVLKTLAKGGPARFYSGFPTFYARIAPHAMFTLLAQDAIRKLWNKPTATKKHTFEHHARKAILHKAETATANHWK